MGNSPFFLTIILDCFLLFMLKTIPSARCLLLNLGTKVKFHSLYCSTGRVLTKLISDQNLSLQGLDRETL